MLKQIAIIGRLQAAGMFIASVRSGWLRREAESFYVFFPNRKIMNAQIDRELSLLSAANESPLNIVELRRVLRWRTESLQRYVQSLTDQGLLRVKKDSSGRGRPRNIVTTTPLGVYFLRKISELDRLRLKLTDADIRKTMRQANRTQELAELGRSPYETFWELTELAWNLRHAKEDPQDTRR